MIDESQPAGCYAMSRGQEAISKDLQKVLDAFVDDGHGRDARNEIRDRMMRLLEEQAAVSNDRVKVVRVLYDITKRKFHVKVEWL